MSSTLIVTSANARFFRLLAGLMLSIEQHQGERKAEVAFLDIGLTPAQRDWLAPRIVQSMEPGWDLELPAALRREQPHLRALTARPFLPRYFPGYDAYLWIDADVWLQDWRGVELYSLGAQAADIAATPHTDRAYTFNRALPRFTYQQFVDGYGKAVADALSPRQHLNAGIFAARADSPLWARWAEAYRQAITASGGGMISDQTSLNYACHHAGLRMQLLPALYNWQSHLAVPLWNPRLGKFCEPHLPHAPLSMLHLTHKTKDQVYDIGGLDGQLRKMTLQNPAVDPAVLPKEEV